MKLFEKRFWTCLALLFITGCNCNKGGPMKEFEGVYRGFAPTDESAVMMGELEVTITNEKINVRMATGLEVKQDEVLVSDFEPMSPEEVAVEYGEGSSLPARTVGFRGEAGYPKLLFLKDSTDDEPGLIVRTGGIVEEVFGPQILYSQAQVQRGCFEKAISDIEAEAGKGVVPRLRNNGKAEGE